MAGTAILKPKRQSRAARRSQIQRLLLAESADAEPLGEEMIEDHYAAPPGMDRVGEKPGPDLIAQRLPPGRDPATVPAADLSSEDDEERIGRSSGLFPSPASAPSPSTNMPLIASFSRAYGKQSEKCGERSHTTAARIRARWWYCLKVAPQSKAHGPRKPRDGVMNERDTGRMVS